MAFGEQLHEFALAWRQARPGLGCAGRAALADLVDDDAHDIGAQVDLPGRHLADRPRKLVERAVLEHITAGAGVEHRQHHAAVVVHRQAQRSHGGRLVADAAHRFQAIEPGHRDIDDGDIRLQLARQLHGLQAVVGLADDLDIAFA